MGNPQAQAAQDRMRQSLRAALVNLQGVSQPPPPAPSLGRTAYRPRVAPRTAVSERPDLPESSDVWEGSVLRQMLKEIDGMQRENQRPPNQPQTAITRKGQRLTVSASQMDAGPTTPKRRK